LTADGDTIMIFAIKNDMDFLITELLNTRVNLNQVGKDKKTAIYVLLSKKKFNLLMSFFNKNFDVNIKDVDGTPLLHVLFDLN